MSRYPIRRKARHAGALLAAALLPLLAACSSFGPATALPGGLTARMDQPGVTLDRREALALINSYRAGQGGGALVEDGALNAQAEALAAAYARSGQAPRRPDGARALLVSAGYPDFANVFSGWRATTADGRVLADAGARRAGLAVSYIDASTYGLYWVLLLAE